MLEELRVRNYALIDELDLAFHPGLNVLSGETGAGKSILIGALGILLGGKADGQAVRTGTDEAEVSGRLYVGDNRDVAAWLEEREIVPEEGGLLLRRTVKSSGRGSISIQSRPVTKQELAELTALLFDIHGQHEHQSLLQPDRQRALLDRFSGLEEETEALKERFALLKAKRKELEEQSQDEGRMEQELDLLRFAVNEIEQAALKPGEEETLQDEKQMLGQGEKIFEHLEELERNLWGGGGAVEGLRGAMKPLGELGSLSTELADLSRRFDSAFYEIEDVAESLKAYRDGVDFSPQRLEACESRLAEIRRLEKKYGPTITSVLGYREEALARIEGIENRDTRLEELRGEISRLEQELLSRAAAISTRRKQGGAELGKRIQEQIRPLGMPKARFHVAVEPRLGGNGKPVCGPYGTDRIEFLIEPNPGEGLKSLRSIASGGEVSRIMLAVKSVLAETDSIDTLVFDEIDAGIGGEVALAVGEHLQSLGACKQILCITHLASIAARADNHVKVEKALSEERARTAVYPLDSEARRRELARMLSGDSRGELSLQHADELISKLKRRTETGEVK